jgi:hypothetical protein
MSPGYPNLTLPGPRVTQLPALAVSRMTLLRLIGQCPCPVPAPCTVTVPGVDFAFRKGMRYGSILVEMHTRRPVGHQFEGLTSRRCAGQGCYLGVCVARGGGN